MTIDHVLDGRFMDILRSNAYCTPPPYPAAVALFMGIVIGIIVTKVIRKNDVLVNASRVIVESSENGRRLERGSRKT